VELTRSALVSAEAGSALDEGGVWYPDDRPFLALRGEMPKWLPYINELLQLIGGGGYMCTPSEADLKGPLADQIAKYYQAADADAVAAVLPEGLTPFAGDPGRCAALFVDWQSCSDSGEELLDPVRGQYKEFFIIANAMLSDEHVTTCPYIWVDRDFALIRGWIQGFPKKLGEVHITRSFGLDCKAEGRTFAGTLTAHGRLLAEASVTLERLSEHAPTHNDPPLINRSLFPRLAAGRLLDAAVDELVRARSSDRSISAI